MASDLEVHQSPITPTGTSAVITKENPDHIRAFIREREARSNDRVAEITMVMSHTKVPADVDFGLMRDSRIVVLRPIPVSVQRDGDVYVATWEQAEEFGYGPTRSDALEDFGRTISQLFITLEREKETLGPHLLDTLDLLRAHLRFRG
jgi:hypothetical protein